MGLDLYFREDKAHEAGAEFRRHTSSYMQYDNEPDYQTDYSILVPGMKAGAQCTFGSDKGLPVVSVRANKWGNNYEPLTRWLTENNIKWEEY